MVQIILLLRKATIFKAGLTEYKADPNIFEIYVIKRSLIP